MAAVQSLKRRLACLAIVNKYKALKEIDAGQSCIASATKHGVGKNTVSHWVKRKLKYLKQLKETMILEREKESILAMVCKLEEPIEIEDDEEDGDDSIGDKCMEKSTSSQLHHHSYIITVTKCRLSPIGLKLFL